MSTVFNGPGAVRSEMVQVRKDLQKTSVPTTILSYNTQHGLGLQRPVETINPEKFFFLRKIFSFSTLYRPGQ